MYRFSYMVLILLVSAWLLPLVYEALVGDFMPSQQDLTAVLWPPLRGVHMLGTDHLGRDVAAGVLNGWRVAVYLGISSTLVALVLSLVLGFYGGIKRRKDYKIRFLTAILRGGIIFYSLYGAYVFILAQQIWGLCSLMGFYFLIQKIISWVEKKDKTRLFSFDISYFGAVCLDIIQAIPALLWLIWVAQCLPTTGYGTLLGVLVCLQIPPLLRLIQAEIHRAATLQYVENAQILGISGLRLLGQHIFPNIFPNISAAAVLSVAQAIALESVCAYLGMGVPLESVTWGRLLQIGQEYPEAWWLVLWPSLALGITLGGLQYWAAWIQQQSGR